MSRYIFTAILLLSFTNFTNAQDTYVISGTIRDSINTQVVAAAAVLVKGTGKGTVTHDDGSFELKTSLKLPITLIISSVGYRTQEFIVTNGAQALSI